MDKTQKIKEFLSDLMKTDARAIEKDWIKFVFLRDKERNIKYPSIYVTDYYLDKTDAENIINRLREWQIDKKLEGIKIGFSINSKLDENNFKEFYNKNKNKKITGIVDNTPFPSNFTEELIFSTIDHKKDIEGMNPYNLGLLFVGEPLFVSPTVLSILEFIKMSGIDLYGKQVTIVGFSTLIGKPLTLILGRKLATVTITHIGTYESGKLPFYIKNSDIVVSAVGKPHIIKGEWIKKGAVVIDVGIGEFNGKVVGDIEFEKAKRRAAFITPVPGGVGKLTSLFLFKNLIDAYKKYA